MATPVPAATIEKLVASAEKKWGRNPPLRTIEACEETYERITAHLVALQARTKGDWLRAYRAYTDVPSELAKLNNENLQASQDYTKQAKAVNKLLDNYGKGTPEYAVLSELLLWLVEMARGHARAVKATSPHVSLETYVSATLANVKDQVQSAAEELIRYEREWRVYHEERERLAWIQAVIAGRAT